MRVCGATVSACRPVNTKVDCMGVSNLNAEMLLANYFSAGMLARHAKALARTICIQAVTTC